MRTIKQFIAIGLTLLGMLTFSVLTPATAAADTSTDAAKQQACIGEGGTWSNGQCSNGGPQLDNLIKSVISVLGIMVGIAAVIMIMVGGFRYVTSAGDSGAIATAKRTIIYAIIGLVVAALSQFIVRYVIGAATGTNTNQIQNQG